MRLVKTVSVTVLPVARQTDIPGFWAMLTRPVDEMVWWCEEHGVRYLLKERIPAPRREPRGQLQMMFDGSSREEQAMQFAPRSEKEIRAAQAWPVGVYPFEVLERAFLGGREIETCETTSQAGKDMIVLVLRVRREGEQRIIVDYLMPEAGVRLRRACMACGLGDEYEAGELHAADFLGKSGTVRLVIERGKGVQPDRNAVGDYVAAGGLKPPV